MSTTPSDKLSPLLTTQEQILALLSAANLPKQTSSTSSDAGQDQDMRMESASMSSQSPPPSGNRLAAQPTNLVTPATAAAVTSVEVAPTSHTTVTTATTTDDEPTNRPGTPGAETTEAAESAESLDPLSHLTHIFDKIRKQVIEWGEDANWKIDVFLLPNEDGAPTPGLPPHDPQLLSQGPATPARATVATPRIDLTGSPPRFPSGTKDIDVGRSSGSGSRGFALQPPPNDLPLSKGLGVPGSLSEHEIKHMSEAEAKRMLSLATRQIQVQQESLSQAVSDLESMQRLSAKREREAEARLEVEQQLMKRDAIVLSKKLRETSITLMEKDREIKDVQLQLETGKRLIKERSEERRKRIDDPGSVPPRSSSGHPETSSDAASGTPGRSDANLPYHQHRHRHVHYHRHHHRHLRRKTNVTLPAGSDSLENLAMLASQVLSREPLPVPKTNPGGEVEGERKKRQIDDRDRGLQLRPMKRPESNGYQKDGLVSQSSESQLNRVDLTKPSVVSNGKLKAQDHQQQPPPRHPTATLMRAPSQQSTSSSANRPPVKPQQHQQQHQQQQQPPQGSDRTEHPVIDSDPHFNRVVRYMRGSDYVAWGALTAGAPAILLALERVRPAAGPKGINFAVGLATAMGFMGGFLYSYQKSSLRFWGWEENAREQAMNRKEMDARAAAGLPAYGEPTMDEAAQAAAARNSKFAALKFAAIPWFNTTNHKYHLSETINNDK
ncbi:hypothetical protein BGZ95_001797 [Linnemannia exigua]|uniref:NADH-ubiquinone oxidoreductase 21kDa subunit N-terminal domain-containing protein n=1 Tax=Linnemannia exigua TaxID=604196 RepID=A0AAD4HAS0_9FUNG|nr:hypothetical protein BGZ95_001797 [Linnemannia exigua]